MNKEEVQHTPTPWRVSHLHWGFQINSMGRVPQVIVCREWAIDKDSKKVEAANAEFIVTAVNSHDQLVAALKDVLADADDRGITQATINKVRAALEGV